MGSRWANGGGCVVGSPPTTVYVGPYAQVLGGTVSGNARIEDHAVVTAGTVSAGTVGGLSILMNGFSVTGGEGARELLPARLLRRRTEHLGFDAALRRRRVQGAGLRAHERHLLRIRRYGDLHPGRHERERGNGRGSLRLALNTRRPFPRLRPLEAVVTVTSL